MPLAPSPSNPPILSGWCRLTLPFHLCHASHAFVFIFVLSTVKIIYIGLLVLILNTCACVRSVRCDHGERDYTRQRASRLARGENEFSRPEAGRQKSSVSGPGSNYYYISLLSLSTKKNTFCARHLRMHISSYSYVIRVLWVFYYASLIMLKM